MTFKLQKLRTSPRLGLAFGAVVAGMTLVVAQFGGIEPMEKFLARPLKAAS